MEKETAGHGRSSGRADVLRLPLSDGESCLTPAVGSAAITAGEIRYTDCGNGPTLVFLHGVLMAGSVWDLVVDRLRSRYRCIVPTLPLGAHTKPVRPDADLSHEGFGRIVNDLLEKLDLHEVTLIGNDHAAVLAAAADPSDRVSRLVITSCEAFENYPPGLPGKNLWLGCSARGPTRDRRAPSIPSAAPTAGDVRLADQTSAAG
jgi:pimeloyl-ACP methyl ester carboxylesterase